MLIAILDYSYINVNKRESTLGYPDCTFWFYILTEYSNVSLSVNVRWTIFSRYRLKNKGSIRSVLKIDIPSINTL
nr:MAG TPA: hypothetical protein [Caudoviricetes sp.]